MSGASLVKTSLMIFVLYQFTKEKKQSLKYRNCSLKCTKNKVLNVCITLNMCKVHFITKF